MSDIDIGKILEILNDKADADLNNTQAFKKTGGQLSGQILIDNVLARSPSETELMIKAGSELTDEDGALFVVYGKNGVSAGQFLARACSADGKMYDLRGSPDGKLQWNGYDIVRQQGINKSRRGYLKLTNGIIIQWGDEAGFSDGDQTITYPTAFTSETSYAIFKNYHASSSTAVQYREINFRGKTATSAYTWNQTAVSQRYTWFAIGY